MDIQGHVFQSDAVKPCYVTHRVIHAFGDLIPPLSDYVPPGKNFLQSRIVKGGYEFFCSFSYSIVLIEKLVCFIVIFGRLTERSFHSIPVTLMNAAVTIISDGFTRHKHL